MDAQETEERVATQSTQSGVIPLEMNQKTTASDESVDKAEQLRVTCELLKKSEHEVAELRRELEKKTKDCATAIIEKVLYAEILNSESLHNERTLGDRGKMMMLRTENEAQSEHIRALRSNNEAQSECIQKLKSNHRDFQVALQNYLDGIKVLFEIHWGRVDQLIDFSTLHGIDTSKIRSEFKGAHQVQMKKLEHLLHLLRNAALAFRPTRSSPKSTTDVEEDKTSAEE